MYILYKAYGKFSPVVYYGYKKDGEDIKSSIEHSLNTNHNTAAIKLQDRADYKLVELNGGINNIIIEEIDIFDTEDEAWYARNSIRADDVYSITGPTPFPINLANRIEKTNPGTTKEWSKRWKITKAKTAREAYRMGKWTKEEIFSLKGKHKRDIVMRDLETISPNDFAEKYFA